MPESPAEPAAPVSESPPPTFGLLLRKLRLDSGLSQDGLAERARISAKTIGALEQGARRAAHDDTIHRIADALQLPAAERNALLIAAQYTRARRPEAEPASEAPRHNLPASLTSFVDRSEIANVVALLDASRLVTITGTGGVGKTRTAIEVARRATDATWNLWFVDLSKLRSGKTILSELASVLAIGSTGADAADTYAAVVRRLNAHPSRLLLDNGEHVLDALAELVPRLLQSCPRLSILATSREPLSLSFEASYRLPSLDLPKHRIANVDEAFAYASVRLFLARTDSGREAWLLKPSSLEKIGILCRQLEGIPLAIELAASRVSTLGLDLLLEELTRGLTLSGKRDYPERHQTMTATIAWSYDLLDATERAVLRRLSVFAGSFTLDVAQRVCADCDLPAYTIVDACHRLAQKSLIVVEPGEPMRYRLLGAIRAFGESRMSPNEREALHGAFTHWLRELSDAAHLNLPGRTVETTTPGFDNMRAGVDWCLERGGPSDLLDAAAIVGGFRRLWVEANRTRDLPYYVEYLIERVDAERQSHLVSRLLLALCLYASRDELPAVLARTIPVLVADGNLVAAAVKLADLANYQAKLGDLEEANRSLRDSFSHLKDVDPARNRAYWRCLIERAWISCAQGDTAQATADLAQLSTYLDDVTDPDRRERSKVQMVAAEIAFVRGEPRKAIELAERELADADEPPIFFEFFVRTNLAVYQTALGDGESALHNVRIIFNEFADVSWAPVFQDYFLILVPAAAAAVSYGNARLGAIILGHFNEHWLKSRTILATEAPAYEKLVEILEARFTRDELHGLFGEGAAIRPDAILGYIRADALFA